MNSGIAHWPRNQDLAAWRARGQATAFGDAPMRPIGGG